MTFIENYEIPSMNDEQLTLFEGHAINITLYDISGAPIDPQIKEELIAKAEELAKRDALLALTVINT